MKRTLQEVGLARVQQAQQTEDLGTITDAPDVQPHMARQLLQHLGGLEIAAMAGLMLAAGQVGTASAPPLAVLLPLTVFLLRSPA